MTEPHIRNDAPEVYDAGYRAGYSAGHWQGTQQADDEKGNE